MSQTKSPDPELLARLEQMIALLEEQTYYLSLLISGEAELEEPGQPPATAPPSNPQSRAESLPKLVFRCRDPDLARLLVEYLNANLAQAVQGSRLLKIIPHEGPGRMM